jgi:LuxR family maltose regulon positive regulatory protein
VSDEKVVDIQAARTGGARDSDTEVSWLLVGKLAPPLQRVSAARRSQLLARLDANIDVALSVIVSPPGFGKTTLLTQWWQALPARGVVRCWLSLDEADSDPGRFLSNVILAVAAGGVEVGALEISARQLLIDMNVRQLAATFLNQIRRTQRPILLVLDDYHRARSPAVDGIIELLIEHGHPSLRLVISTRQRPTFHVSALSARGLVAMLDANDLSMTVAEVSEILGPDVSEADLTLLHARTEGWPVAIQLARLWLERGQRKPGSLRDFSGRTLEMTEYLSEQIVQDLPVELREFLLETSILDRFDANLADAVRDRTDSAELLERLSYLDALLVRLEGTPGSFRYHAMFADFLSQRLHRSPAGRVAAQHRRAARWLASAGDLHESVKHAIKAGDTDLAVEMLQNAGGWEVVLWRGIGYVRALLRLFSDVTIRANPVLQMTQAYIDMKMGQYDRARELLDLTEVFLDPLDAKMARDYAVISSLRLGYTDDMLDPSVGRAYEAQVERFETHDHLGRGTLLAYVVLSALASGDLRAAERTSRWAIREMRAAGSVLGANYFFLHLGQSQLLSGRLREAEALYREALAMAEENFGVDSGLKALSATFLSEAHYWRDDLAGAESLLSASLDTIENTDGWLDAYATAYEVTARQAFAAGHFEQTLRAIERASELARQRQLKRLSSMAAAWRVEHLAVAGHVKEARREAQVAGLATFAEHKGPPDYHWRIRLAATMALARVSMASGASAPALKLLDGAVADFQAGGLYLHAHRLRALSVVALKQRGGQDAEATTRMEALVQYIVEEGAARLIMEHGHALEGVLHVVQRRNRELILSGAQRDVTARLLAKLQQSSLPGEHGFSARELAVLTELCNGRSNKVIGQLLDLSENTVKFHLKRVFKKLNVDSRAAAIAAALQRGVVSASSATRSVSK